MSTLPVTLAVPPITTRPLLAVTVVGRLVPGLEVRPSEMEVAVNAPPLTWIRVPSATVLVVVIPPLKFAAPDLKSNRPDVLELLPKREDAATLTVWPSTTTVPLLVARKVLRLLVPVPPSVRICPNAPAFATEMEAARPGLMAPFRLTLPVVVIVLAAAVPLS